MLSVEDMRSFTTPGNGSITGMGGLDEEISAMLQSSHSTLSQASLAGVMAPDIFSSFTSHASPYPGALPPSNPHQGGLARTASLSSAGLSNNSRLRPHPNSRNNQPQNQSQRCGPMTGDEKWMLDAKGEVLDIHTSNSPFGAVFDNSFGMPMMNPAPTPAAAAAAPPSGGLHRYHSAPSAFLQALADDAFSQIPPPTSNVGPLFSEGGLTSITEVMDVERTGSGNSINEFEQFLSPDSDFSRRAAMSALQAKPENAETFANLFPPAKNTGLMRQKSLPVAQQNIKSKQDPMEEQHSEESISGTSEDNSLVTDLKASMFSPDDLFSSDTLTSWPTSPGTPGGKRPRGFPGESEISSGSAENPKSYRLNNNQNGLIRHMSLPTSTDGPPTPNPNSGDELYVQMRARAKRGCATHPRSIAERVRRTRISERMKKLQDLVPNMEKTTNTSDMLDETVEYVKSLQLKVSELQETIAQLKAAGAQIKSP